MSLNPHGHYIISIYLCVDIACNPAPAGENNVDAVLDAALQAWDYWVRKPTHAKAIYPYLIQAILETHSQISQKQISHSRGG